MVCKKMGISEMVIVYKKWNENNQDDLKKTIAYLSN
jgi:NADH:ubiquinone oxidoreductase subunit 4 (subunit M)